MCIVCILEIISYWESSHTFHHTCKVCSLKLIYFRLHFLGNTVGKKCPKKSRFPSERAKQEKKKIAHFFFSFTFWGFLVINSSWNSVGRGRQRSTDFSSWRKCMLLKMCCVPSGSEFFLGARIINLQNFYLMSLKNNFFSKKKAWNYSQKMHRKIEVEVYTIVS